MSCCWSTFVSFTVFLANSPAVVELTCTFMLACLTVQVQTRSRAMGQQHRVVSHAPTNRRRQPHHYLHWPNSWQALGRVCLWRPAIHVNCVQCRPIQHRHHSAIPTLLFKLQLLLLHPQRLVFAHARGINLNWHSDPFVSPAIGHASAQGTCCSTESSASSSACGSCFR